MAILFSFQNGTSIALLEFFVRHKYTGVLRSEEFFSCCRSNRFHVAQYLPQTKSIFHSWLIITPNSSFLYPKPNKIIGCYFCCCSEWIYHRRVEKRHKQKKTEAIVCVRFAWLGTVDSLVFVRFWIGWHIHRSQNSCFRSVASFVYRRSTVCFFFDYLNWRKKQQRKLV